MIMVVDKQFGAIMLPLHPHNASLQVWLELGVAGIAMYLAACLMVLAWIARAPRFAGAFALGLFVTVFLISNVSFSLWRSTWVASMWFAAAMFVAVQGQARDVEAG